MSADPGYCLPSLGEACGHCHRCSCGRSLSVVCEWLSDGSGLCAKHQAQLDNHYGHCTLPPDHDGPCRAEGAPRYEERSA